MRSYIASKKITTTTTSYDSILSPLGGFIDRDYPITINPLKVKCLFPWIIKKVKFVFLLSNG